MDIEEALEVFEHYITYQEVYGDDLDLACRTAIGAITASKMFDRIAAEEISKLTGKDIDVVFEEFKKRAYEEVQKMKNE